MLGRGMHCVALAVAVVVCAIGLIPTKACAQPLLQTTTDLTSSPNPSTFGQSVTFTATVTPRSGTGTPTGTVTFEDGTTTIGIGTLNASGQATLTTSSLTTGVHRITAVYSGDATFKSSTSSPPLRQTVTQAGTSTALTSSLNPSAVGQAVTFTATVTPASGSGTPTGSVTFMDGTTAIGTGTLNASGQASFTTSSLSAGSHSITAVYGGDSNFTGSTSPVLTQVVGKTGTSTALTSSLNPSAVGQAVTFTATVTPASGSGTPTGTVTFKDGTTTLGTVPLSGTTAVLATSSLAVGSHSITATYSGDATFAPSTSPVLTQVVKEVSATATTTTLASSVNPSTFGQSVTFTATVVANNGSGTPTGTVTFMEGPTTLGTGTLSGGQATFTTSSLVAGNHTVTAIYGGDANSASSTSPALTQVVNQAPTATALASSVNPSNVDQAVTFTATVTSGSGTPTGSVTFKDGATAIGIATLSAGAAAFTTSSLTLGTHTITASYGGAAGFVASTSPALTQTVQIPPDSVRLRALQIAVTKMEALSSGDAFAGAIDGAIADGFSEGGSTLITPSGNGVRLNFAAEPDAGRNDGRAVDQYDSVLAMRANALRDSGLSAMNQNLPASVRSFVPDPSTASARVDEAFTTLAYTKPMMTKAPPLVPAAPKVWQLWADVRGTGWNTDPSTGDIRGGQVNAIAGLTRKLTPDFLVGVLGGYENFDYTSQTLNGRLKGDRWTVGGYLGWRIWPGVRFDAAVGRSGVSYNGVSGTAAAAFPGNRWLASAGLTGMYRTQWFEITPSAKAYAIWERDSSYIDSLGTLQAENTFSTGRASAGVKVAYPIYWAAATVAPYVGL
jgi:hypothetical protein